MPRILGSIYFFYLLKETQIHTDNFPSGLELKTFVVKTKCSEVFLLAIELSLICYMRNLELQSATGS